MIRLSRQKLSPTVAVAIKVKHWRSIERLPAQFISPASDPRFIAVLITLPPRCNAYCESDCRDTLYSMVWCFVVLNGKMYPPLGSSTISEISAPRGEATQGLQTGTILYTRYSTSMLPLRAQCMTAAARGRTNSSKVQPPA